MGRAAAGKVKLFRSKYAGLTDKTSTEGALDTVWAVPLGEEGAGPPGGP